jgi:hypothetical protein
MGAKPVPCPRCVPPLVSLSQRQAEPMQEIYSVIIADVQHRRFCVDQSFDQTPVVAIIVTVCDQARAPTHLSANLSPAPAGRPIQNDAIYARILTAANR